MILITGANGQLGNDIKSVCQIRGLDYIATDTKTMDITDKNQIISVFKQYPVSSVIHCAAYTAVDRAEDEKEICMKINVDGTRNLSEVCADYDAKLLYISTDYVFDGLKDGFYETDDVASPKSVYGLSKYLGELAVKENISKYYIVRVSWVFGLHGHNFIRTMLKLSETKDQISVVSDQLGSPTYTKDLAPLLIEIILSEKYGVYHATNEEVCSWFDFSNAIFKEVNKPIKVFPILTVDYPTKAQRPLNSRLSKSSLDIGGFSRLPSWKSALNRYIKELKEGGLI